MSTQPAAVVPEIAKLKFPDLPAFLTQKATAQYLSVSLATIKRWRKEQRFAFLQHGPHCIRIPRAEVESLLRAKFVARR